MRIAAFALASLVCTTACAQHTARTVKPFEPALNRASIILGAPSDPAARCQQLSVDGNASWQEIYDACIVGSHLLRLSAKPEPSKDDDVTAAILEIYAANALEKQHASAQRVQTLLSDARERLTTLIASNASAEVRSRARAARACLIDLDGPCRVQWANAQ